MLLWKLPCDKKTPVKHFGMASLRKTFWYRKNDIISWWIMGRVFDLGLRAWFASKKILTHVVTCVFLSLRTKKWHHFCATNSWGRWHLHFLHLDGSSKSVAGKVMTITEGFLVKTSTLSKHLKKHYILPRDEIGTGKEKQASKLCTKKTRLYHLVNWKSLYNFKHLELGKETNNPQSPDSPYIDNRCWFSCRVFSWDPGNCH